MLWEEKSHFWKSWVLHLLLKFCLNSQSLKLLRREGGARDVDETGLFDAVLRIISLECPQYYNHTINTDIRKTSPDWYILISLIKSLICYCAWFLWNETEWGITLCQLFPWSQTGCSAFLVAEDQLTL